jgi:hypothetical protein
MAVYCVLTPLAAAGVPDVPDRVRFEKQGFSFGALLFGPVWLLARGLWRAFVGWCALVALILVAARYDLISSDVALVLIVLLQIYLGFTARGEAAAAYERAGWRLADIAVGADRASAERSYFSRWRETTPPASAPPPPRRPGGPSSHPHHIIGLFPEAGG